MVNISLHPKKFTSKPGKVDAGLITSSIANHPVDISFNEFVCALNDGKTWCPGTFRNGVRKASKWLSQQCFVADIDDHNYDYDQIMEMCESFDLPLAIAHESFSSTPDHHKWRLVFICEKVLTDPVTCLGILRKIQNHFKSDTCTIDLSRLLYSCNNAVRYSKEVYFKLDDSLEIHKFIKPTTKKTTKALDKFPDKSNISDKRFNFLRDLVIRKIRNLGNQPRYQVVWHSTRMLAQSGIFSSKDIINTVMFAVNASGKFEDYDKDVNEIINTAMVWGRQHQWVDNDVEETKDP